MDEWKAALIYIYSSDEWIFQFVSFACYIESNNLEPRIFGARDRDSRFQCEDTSTKKKTQNLFVTTAFFVYGFTINKCQLVEEPERESEWV